MTGNIPAVAHARTPWGLRPQLLIALALVTVLAIVTTGYIALWAAGDSLRESREKHATLLAAAIGQSLQDAWGKKGFDGNDPRPLLAILRRLVETTGSVELSVVGPGKRELASWPPRAPEDVEAQVVTIALAGGPPVINYRQTPGGTGKQLVAYAAIGAEDFVPGVVRVVLDATSPTEVVLRRSGLLLLVLVVLNALLVLGLSYFILTQLVVRPLGQLRQKAAQLSAGNGQIPAPLGGAKEIVALGVAFDDMTASLANQREQLIRSEKLMSVGQLAAGVAHEIGNPLATILGYVDILRKDTESPAEMDKAERLDALMRVKAETQRIHHIIRDLLEYSRPSREEPVPTDPLHFAQSAQSLLSPQTRFRDVKVLFTPSDETWPQVLIAPNRLVQVFVNLLMNAADAMGGKGTVVVACEDRGEKIVISMIDEGPGIPSDIQSRIFDPFFTTKSVGQGTGLGLSVCRSIVESAGGSLELSQSQAGRGATFIMTLKSSGTRTATP